MKVLLVLFLVIFSIVSCNAMEEREEIEQSNPTATQRELNMQLIEVLKKGLPIAEGTMAEETIVEEEAEEANDEEAMAQAVADLIEQGADPNVQDIEGNTPLLIAVHSNLEIMPTIIHYLIEGGAAPSLALSNKNGVTPLMAATLNKDVDTVSSFIRIGNRNHIDIGLNRPDKGGDTPLTIAIDKATNDPQKEEEIEDDKTLVRKLIQAGADPNLKNEILGNFTPVMLAIIKKNPFMIDTLLSYGADPNSQDSLGNTALLLATAFNIPSIVGILLKHKADPNKVNSLGNTPILIAFRNDLESPSTKSIILQLLFLGADPDIKNNAGISARSINPQALQKFEEVNRLMKQKFNK